MPQVRTVLVTGATGMQGGATVEALRDAGFTVRALVRAPASPKAVALAAKGVVLAQGHFDDPTGLSRAMEGADGVFFMQNVSPPDDPGAEVRHGRNLVEAARQAGVTAFVHTSVARAGRQHEFAGWAEGRWPVGYWNGKSGVNDIVRDAGFARWTILKPAYMLDNFVPPKVVWMYPALRNRVIETAMAPDAKLDVLAASDVGRFVVAAFADPERLSGKEIDLACAKVTMPEVAQLISAATGVAVASRTHSAAELIEKGYVSGLVDSHLWANVEGYRVDIARAASFGISLETPKEWCNRNRARFAFA